MSNFSILDSKKKDKLYYDVSIFNNIYDIFQQSLNKRDLLNQVSLNIKHNL